jgi:hypothetical protein
MRATASLELSFLFESDTLQEVGVEGKNADRFYPNRGCALSSEDRDRVWCALPGWLQERLLADAVELYEPVSDDDVACDMARSA